jgi:hypothetical protein
LWHRPRRDGDLPVHCRTAGAAVALGSFGF